MHVLERSVVRLLGAAGIAVATLAAVAIAGGGAANAANGDAVKLGQANSATAVTSITTTSGNGLSVTSADGTALQGFSDVIAIYGSGGAQGVHGTAQDIGVLGESYGSGGSGVLGQSSTGYGVTGKTSDGGRAGLYGQNDGNGGGGSGVVGVAPNNIGVSAISANGTALAVTGLAAFSRSGKATVPNGSKKVVVNNIKLYNGSMILALVQVTGAPAVKAAVPDVANGRFTIYLAKVTTKNVVVAWFVLS